MRKERKTGWIGLDKINKEYDANISLHDILYIHVYACNEDSVKNEAIGDRPDG